MNLKLYPLTRSDCYNDGKFLKPPKGIMVHSTATPGVMAMNFAKAWNKSYKAGEMSKQVAVNAFVDDKEVVQCFEWNKRTWHCGKSGNNTHISFEICEPSGHRYEGGSRMVGYEPAKHQKYFEAIWENSVELCAFLCMSFNLNPLEPGVLICHSEGYKLGIASNHGDVMHWFPHHGKDMDQFREEVKRAMDKERLDNTPDGYAKEAVEWALRRQILKGDDQGNLKLHEPITRQDTLVFMKRVIDLMK